MTNDNPTRAEKAEESRAWRHGPMPGHVRSRFVSKISIVPGEVDPCWMWSAATDRHGYGQFKLHAGMQAKAHRVAYRWLRGPIEDDLVIDHLCRNHSCVNPYHLEPVSNRENILRGVAPSAVNAIKVGCINGHGFTADNTYITPEGERGCLECRRKASRDYQRRRRAA